MATLFRGNKIYYFITLCMCLMLSACDPTASKNPFNFPNTKWICEELNIWFIVDHSPKAVLYGQMQTEAGVQELGLVCWAGSRASIHNFEAVANRDVSTEEAHINILWSAKVIYKEDEFTLCLPESEYDTNCLFPEESFPITFVREELSEKEIREISPWDEDGNLKETREVSETK